MPHTHLVPPDAEARLGFDALRARLRGHARTPYGRERIDAMRPQAEAAPVRERLARAGEMRAALDGGAAVGPRSVDDLRPVLARLAPKDARVGGEGLDAARRTLAALRELSDAVQVRREAAPALWAVAVRIVVLKQLENRIERTVDEAGRVRDDASPELARLSREITAREGRRREALLAALKAAAADGYATEEQPSFRAGRPVIPVRAEAKRKVAGFVQDVSATGQTVYIEPASVVEATNEIRELEIARGHEVDRLLGEVSAHLRHHRREILRSLDALAVLDEAYAAGRMAQALDALVPEVGEGGPLRLVRARNPVLALHLAADGDADGGPSSVVPLDLALGEPPDPDARAPEPPEGGAPEGAADPVPVTTLVVTGPNAGGKSVALKTVGLLSLMAACGLPVPAAPGTRIPLPTRLFVDLGDRQSIEDDLSTFTSHLQTLGQILETADDRSLVLIDEAGTGTDPAEGGALAEAVLRRLTRRGTPTVATTHVGALKAFAHDTPGADNASMEFSREALAPTYRFRVGVPGSSYAFEIARRVGLDPPVIEEARARVGEGAARLEDLIAEFEGRTERAERLAAESEERLRKAERLQADYEQRLEQHRAQRDALRAKALAEADGILADANAAVERAVREIREAEAEREATQAAREGLAETRAAVAKRARNVAKRQSRRAPAPAARPRRPEADGPIRVGDRVRLDGDGAEGEVLELDDREAVVALGALKTRVRLGRLTRVGGRRQQRVEVRQPKAQGGAPRIASVQARLDLRGERVEAALAAVQRLVDEAQAAGLARVEIVHGKGTGALRAAIHEQLGARPDLAGFAVAPMDQGGDGVTVVRLG